jgi:hypothetical protein
MQPSVVEQQYCRIKVHQHAVPQLHWRDSTRDMAYREGGVMKIYPAESTESNLMPLIGASLIACDHCGIVAVDTPRFGWKRFCQHNTDVPGGHELDGKQCVYSHHCAAAVQWNEMVAGQMVHMIPPETAVTYEDWIEDDDSSTDMDSADVDGGESD